MSTGIIRRIIRQRFRALFPPRAVRIPGKFPWVQPKPLPASTVLIAGSPPIIADGKGGIAVSKVGLRQVAPNHWLLRWRTMDARDVHPG